MSGDIEAKNIDERKVAVCARYSELCAVRGALSELEPIVNGPHLTPFIAQRWSDYRALEVMLMRRCSAGLEALHQ